MHNKTKRRPTILVINSTLLQTCTKLVNWRSVILYLLELRSSVAWTLKMFDGTDFYADEETARYRFLRKSVRNGGECWLLELDVII